ncbi:MAG: dipeptidase [Myxococcota bacterium]
MLLALVAFAAPPIQADLHLDTPTQLHRKDVGLDGAGLEAGLAQLRAGGTNLAVMVLWPPRGTGAEHVEALLSRMEREDARLDEIALVRDPAEARATIAAGRVAMVYALEGAHGLGDLAALHARGLAMLGLTWSFSNPYAGSSGDQGGGLTDAGRKLVAEAQRLGILVDVSHASRQTTLDVCRASAAPIVASHSNADSVAAHARNLSDEEIACIARTGGVIGVNFHASFVGKGASVAKVADHADHLKKVGGAGVVALGSDYDGIITPPPDLADASKLGALWDELRRRGWTEPEIAAARAENFLRAWAVARQLAYQ